MPKIRKYGTNAKMDKQVDDKDMDVRWQMAYRCYGLDKLVFDKNGYIRATVAKKGYGLDLLITDKDKWVREEALKYLKDNNLTLSEWISKNPDRLAKIG